DPLVEVDRAPAVWLEAIALDHIDHAALPARRRPAGVIEGEEVEALLAGRAFAPIDNEAAVADGAGGQLRVQHGEEDRPDPVARREDGLVRLALPVLLLARGERGEVERGRAVNEVAALA